MLSGSRSMVFSVPEEPGEDGVFEEELFAASPTTRTAAAERTSAAADRTCPAAGRTSAAARRIGSSVSNSGRRPSRAMLLLIGIHEIRLISLDKKRTLLSRSLRDVSTIMQVSNGLIF